MTSSVTDVVLSSTVPSVYFLTVKNSCKEPVKILASLFPGGMSSLASFWLRYYAMILFSVVVHVATFNTRTSLDLLHVNQTVTSITLQMP